MERRKLGAVLGVPFGPGVELGGRVSGMWWLSWGLAEGRTFCVIEGQPCEARGGGTAQGLRGALRTTVGCSGAGNAVLQGLLLGARFGGRKHGCGGWRWLLWGGHHVGTWQGWPLLGGGCGSLAWLAVSCVLPGGCVLIAHSVRRQKVGF